MPGIVNIAFRFDFYLVFLHEFIKNHPANVVSCIGISVAGVPEGDNQNFTQKLIIIYIVKLGRREKKGKI